MRSNSPDVAYALYFSGVDLDSLVADLASSGFIKKDISVVLPQGHFVSQSLRKLRMGENTPAIAQELQQAFEWMQNFGSVMIPQVGVFDSRHEFAGTFFGSHSDQSPCVSALCDLGVKDDKVVDLQEWTKEGGVAVVVSCGREHSCQLAEEVLEEAGAEELSGKKPHSHVRQNVSMQMAS